MRPFLVIPHLRLETKRRCCAFKMMTSEMWNFLLSDSTHLAFNSLKQTLTRHFPLFLNYNFFFFFTPNLTRLLPLRLTCYITALPHEKSNTLEYLRDIKNDGGTLLRLIAHVGSIVQTVCIQLYTSPLNVLSLLSLSSLFTLRSH